MEETSNVRFSKRKYDTQSLRNSNVLHEIYNRQIISGTHIPFLHHMSSNVGLIKRFEQSCSLEEHTGCVNTVQWNWNGDLLISGSDDAHLCIWDYPTQSLKGKIQSGHSANIFCARFMPNTNDQEVISCAGDHEIRFHNVEYSAGKKKFGFSDPTVFECNQGRVKKLATESGNPYLFWSASEDGTIRQYDLREKHTCSRSDCNTLLVDLSTTRESIDLYSISMNPMNPNYFAVGGCDPIVRVYDRRMMSPGAHNSRLQHPCVKRFCPTHIAKRIRSRIQQAFKGHITGVAWDVYGTEILASYSGDGIYLFDFNETSSTDRPDFIPRRSTRTPHTRSANPTAEEERQLGNRAYSMGKYRSAIAHYTAAIEKAGPTPITLYNRAAAHSLRGTRSDLLQAIQDCDAAIQIDSKYAKAYFRKAKVLFTLGDMTGALANAKAAQCLLSEPNGVLEEFLGDVETRIASNIGPPEPLPVDEPEDDEEEFESDDEMDPTDDDPIPEDDKLIHDGSFKQFYTGHANFKTVKEVAFMGPRSEYVVSGSDDGNIFIWKKNTAHIVQVMKGDYSVVNCTQSHPFDCVLATSGIENDVKLWAPTTSEPNPLTNLNQITTRNNASQRDPPNTGVPMALLRQLVRQMNAQAEEDTGQAPPVQCTFQ